MSLPVSALRVSVALTLAIAVAACGFGSVTLVTAEPGVAGCYTSGVRGDLVADGTYGTAIAQTVKTETGSMVVSLPVKWPHGYTGRRSGSEIEVLNASGDVVARTGTQLYILGGSEGEDPRVWRTCEIGPFPPR